MADLEKRVAGLEKQLNQAVELLRRFGITTPAEVSDDPTDRPDYMEPGSKEHLAFLGLVTADANDALQFDTLDGENDTYRLVDPVGPYVGYADPKQAAHLALYQKVESFESGHAVVHDKAPKMWVPEDVKPELARQLRRR